MAKKRSTRKAASPRGRAADAVPAPGNDYVLCLFIAGSTPRSVRAVENLTRICEEHLHGCDLKVIDLYQQPALAAGEGIVAAPTLIKRLPEPVRRLVGDMADESRVLLGLDLGRGQ